jgi:hypothetical protein
LREVTPSALDGYRAMAAAMVIQCWSGEIKQGRCADQRMLAVMLSSLTGVQLSAAAA